MMKITVVFALALVVVIGTATSARLNHQDIYDDDGEVNVEALKYIGLNGEEVEVGEARNCVSKVESYLPLYQAFFCTTHILALNHKIFSGKVR